MALHKSQKIALAAFVLLSGLLGLSVFRGGSGAACRLVPFSEPVASQPLPSTLPAWNLRGIDGSEHSMASMAGDLTIVAFWATWCPNCHKEMATLNELYQAFASSGLSVIGVSLDGAKREQTVVDYATKADLAFPILFTDRAGHAELAAIRAVPTLLIYDAQGQIIAHYEGQTDKSELLRFAEQHLSTVALTSITLH